MAKFVVLNDFKDKETQLVHETGDVVELTVARAKEVASNLGDKFLFRIDNLKEETKEETKEEETETTEDEAGE